MWHRISQRELELLSAAKQKQESESNRQRTDAEAQRQREREEDRAYAAANDRKKRHHDYFVAAFQVCLGALLGLLAEHYFQIIATIIRLAK